MGRKRKYNTDKERKSARKLSMKLWYDKNREVLRQKRMDRYGSEKEYYRQCNRKHYLKNREEIIKKAVKWGQDHREKIHSYREKWKRIHSFHKLVLRANKYHEDKIKPFDLWKIAKKQKLQCALTGDILDRKNISLDHIVPLSKGGKNIVSNVRLVTKDANFMKNSHSDEELLELCKKVVNNHSSK